MKIKLICLFLLAFIFRLIALNQSFWLDEGTTARVVQQYSLFGIITEFSPNDFHPPLFYLVEKLWTSVFGYSEIALRMPSVLFSMLTGWTLYLIGGIWAAALFLFNPLIIYYSQEARMYMMATFFLTAALYYYRNVIARSPDITRTTKQSNSINRWRQIASLQHSSLAMTSVFLIASFYTFYGSIFLIIPMYGYLLYKKKYRQFIVSGLLFGIALTIITPLLMLQLAHSREALNTVINWSSVLGTVNIKNLFLIPLKFVIGRISFYPKWLYWGLTGVWTVYIWFVVIKNGLRQKVFLYLIISSLGLGLIFSVFSPLLQYFRFLYLIPLVCLLLIRNNQRVSHDRRILVIFFGFVFLSSVYLFNPQFHREDWKRLAEALPDNKPVYIIDASADALSYYTKKQTTDLRQIGRATTDKLTVIPYTSEIYGFDYKVNLQQNKLRLVKTTVIRDLIFEEWSR